MVENRKIDGLEKREINVILNDLEFIIKNTNCKLSDQAKYDIIYKIAWEWTEGRTTATKYYGCKYWSKGALSQVFGEENVFNVTPLTYTKKIEDGLRHEHVVPKRLFMEYVWYLVKNPGKFIKTEVKKFIENNLVACVITATEDKKFSDLKIVDKLPESVEDFDKDDFMHIAKFEDVKTRTWNRYKIVGITDIYELEWDVKNKEVKIIGKVNVATGEINRE